MTLLEENKNYASKATYQKVAYYRGIELFIDADYPGAVENFNKSLGSAEDGTFKARAQYWKAESQYLLNNYRDALVDFIQFQANPNARSIPEYKDLPYNLGYTYFKLKDYTNAASYFSKYSAANPSDTNKLHDAYLRLGDSYFVSSKYWPAMEAYNQALALSGPEKDYAAFQKALSYGFVDRTATKIEELNSFTTKYPNSTLMDDALFELGNSYIKENKVDLGLRSYDKLISQYKGKFFGATSFDAPRLGALQCQSERSGIGQVQNSGSRFSKYPRSSASGGYGQIDIC